MTYQDLSMLPKTLALIDDEAEFSGLLSQYLKNQGMQVDVFADSNQLLLGPEPYGYDFYVVDLTLPGIDGVSLIKLLRQRSNAGILVVSGRTSPDVFRQIVDAGADMHLRKPVQFEQVALAIRAVQRRAAADAPPPPPWILDRRLRQLTAPNGIRVELSGADLIVLECLAEAAGQPVSRDALHARLGHQPDRNSTDGLNAAIYRLRRRIERATNLVVPLQSRSRVGYVFRAGLKAL